MALKVSDVGTHERNARARDRQTHSAQIWYDDDHNRVIDSVAGQRSGNHAY